MRLRADECKKVGNKGFSVSIVAQEANPILDKIRVGTDQAYQQISDRDNYVTAEKVRNVFFRAGHEPRNITIRDCSS